MRYALKVLGKPELPLIPGLGAGTFGALIALHVGWGAKFLFVLDGDKAGKGERDRYIADYGVSPERVVTMDQLASGIKEIEDLLDQSALESISSQLQLKTRPSKNQIRRFFQERLASGKVDELGSEFARRANLVLGALEARLYA